MYLSESCILDTLNTDLFPCFDDYNPETYEFTAVYRATGVLRIHGDTFTVTLNTGHSIRLPLAYLLDPAEYKAVAVEVVSESLPK